MTETIAFLDFETTGLFADGGDRPTEVAVVITRSRRIIDRFESLINPGRQIPDFVVRLNGITNEMARNAPNAEAVIRQLYGRIGALPIVAHNASFDRKFLQIELRRVGLRHTNGMHCSMRIARRVYRDAPNHKLGTLVDYAGLAFFGKAHRAMADAEVTAKLWVEMEKRLERDHGLGEVPFDLMLQLQTVKIATVTDFIKEYARKNGLEIAPACQVEQERVFSANTSQKRCPTCLGKKVIRGKYVRRWFRCPDCRSTRH